MALSEGSKGRILLKRMVVFGMDNFYSLTGSQWFSLCAIVGLIVVSLYWAWNKISGLERKVNWLEGFLDTATRKIESLEKDLLEKKVIDSYHKSPEELKYEKTNRELDKEIEDHLKRVEENKSE